MPEITLPVQKAEKVIKPPVKSLQLGDGYEQTFQNAIADVEEWNVTTPPMDDTDANSLEDLLNGLNGDTFTWTPPYSDPGTYRLNSKITRTMVSYMRSTLQFSLKGTSNVRSFYYAPQFLKVFFDSNINASPYPDTYGYSGPYDTPFAVNGFWTYTAFQTYWTGPIINGIQVEGGIYPDTDPFRAWYQSFPVSIYSRGDYSRVVLVPDANPITIQLPNTNLSSISDVRDKETGFFYTLGTHYTQSLIYGQVIPIADTAIADSTGLEIRYRV